MRSTMIDIWHSAPEWTKVAGVLTAALLLRFAVAEWMLAKGRSLFPDSELYIEYAQSLVEGRDYRADGHRARRTPGYPLFIAACWSIGGQSTRAILWGQVLMGTVTCGLAYLLARRLNGASFPSSGCWPSLTFLAIDPYSIVLSGLVLSETISATILTFLACAWLECVNGKTWRAPILFGIAGGALVLVRPSALLLLPLALLAWGWRKRIDSVSRPRLLVAVVALAVVLVPWWIRNAMVFERFVPTALNVGESLYDGIGPQATGASDTSFTAAAKVQGLSEVERDAYWWKEATKALVADPLRTGRLALIKLGRFWSPWPNETRFQDPYILVLTTIGTVPVWLCAVVGIWKVRRRADVLLVCLGPILYFCALHTVFVSSVRYRVPVAAMISVLAGAGIASLRVATTRGSVEMPKVAER